MERTITIQQIKDVAQEAYNLYKDNTDGKNADYIPYLANIDPKLFGISICLMNGEIIQLGDSQYRFGIESVSKVLTAILVLRQYGAPKVLEMIGADATGLPFNSIMAILLENDNPSTPLVNAGAISARAMGMSLSIAVSAAGGLAMLRVITGIPILYFLIPGYFIALALTFFVPRTFTAIAFDSGGVASGPLTATFMLPFAMGACQALGGNVMTDAFGLVALVAMMPLITVQVMGAIYVVKSRRAAAEPALPAFGDNEIIELWEAC